MTIGHSPLIDSALLLEANTTFSTIFNDALQGANGLWYPKIATVVNSGSKVVKFPFMGGLTRMRKWLGERQYQNMARYAVKIEVETYEDSLAVDVDDINDDQFMAYDAGFRELAYQVAQWPQDLLVDLITSNGLSFDGQNFFDTDHPKDLAGRISGTYQNSFTGSALTAPNLKAVIGSMKGILGFDGRPMGFGRAGGLLLVVPAALEYTAKELVAATLVSAGGSNVLSGVADVLVMPELDASSATTWYLADTAHAVKPLLFAQVGTPAVVADMGEIFDQNVMRWGAKARGAAGYGMPWLMAKAVA